MSAGTVRMAVKTIDIALPEPHSTLQRQLIEYPGNVAIFAGRRWGKTEALAQRLFYRMQRQPGLYWWVGLSWKSASMKRAIRRITSIARQIYRALGVNERNHLNRSTMEVRIPGMGEIWFRTADNPSSLAGEGIRGAVVDEFSLMAEIVWTEYLQGTLIDYEGWAAFAGIPKGKNWATNLWLAARDRPGWMQQHATTYDNPLLSRDFIDDIRKNTADDMFRQEYLAEIIASEGQVFHKINQVLVPPEPEGTKHDGHYIVAGVDWAKSNDYTVISVYCTHCGREIALERFNKIDWMYQRKKLKIAWHKYHVDRFLVERNSIGDVMLDMLRRENMPVEGFDTTAASKPEIIENLALAIETMRIRLIDDQIATSELAAYERQLSKSGKTIYGAPVGMHDDTVMARAIMWHGADAGELIIA